ncbi:MAG: sulfatase-like hydrolase/transferase [Kiritimatiellales bacterium]|jgi:arylsulfatase A
MMNHKLTAGISAALTIATGSIAAEKTPARPNIVVILADDLGFEELGCYGGAKYKNLGAVRTPNLDAMAREGMLFRYCFSTPVCSPARAELLTGKYNHRSGFIDIAGRNGATPSLDTQAHPTVAMQLKAAGYVTAVAGKWHVGPPEDMHEIPLTAEADTDYPHPRECGFDRQCIIGGAHLELYGEPKAGAYTPDILQGWALRFLESRKGKAEPFFLYYPSPIPHVPLLPTPLNPDGPRGEIKGNFGQNRGDNANYPYLIEYLDKQVGEVLSKLTELGLRENTLVVFTGDNGTHRAITTEMRDGREIKGGKGMMTDTGSQVPLLAGWPGVIQAGSRYEGLVDFTDILPTCLELAGAKAPGGIDGISFAPQLSGKPGKVREWTHSLLVDKYFVRDAKWKLRENGRLYDVSKSPRDEIQVNPENDTPESKAARIRLQAVMDKLHPAKAGDTQMR